MGRAAAENHQTAAERARGERPPVVGTTGTGTERGAAVIEALTPAKETHRFRERVERALEAANAKLSGER